MEVDADIRLGLKHSSTEAADGENLQYTILYHEQPFGSVQVYGREKNATHMGYSHANVPEAQGKGLVTKSARRLCKYVFEEQGLDEVRLYIRFENLPSMRVATRLGAYFVKKVADTGLWVVTPGVLRNE